MCFALTPPRPGRLRLRPGDRGRSGPGAGQTLRRNRYGRPTGKLDNSVAGKGF